MPLNAGMCVTGSAQPNNSPSNSNNAENCSSETVLTRYVAQATCGEQICNLARNLSNAGDEVIVV